MSSCTPTVAAGGCADIAVAHDGRFEKSVEIHSSWKSFEWLLHDAFRLNDRIGVVANSDGHKRRPGASHPGAGMFRAIGGLACSLMEGLDRPGLLDCMRKRCHHGTTGWPAGRMAIELTGRFTKPGQVYHDDPALADDADHAVASTASMGDIVRLPSGEMDLDVSLVTSAPIENVEIVNGLDLVETITRFERSDLGNRIRILREGTAYRGRFREVIRDGKAEFIGNDVTDMVPVNFLNPERTLSSARETSPNGVQRPRETSAASMSC